MRQRERIAEATRRGKKAGKNAGSWVIDGNTTDATKARIAQGVDDGDPAVLCDEPSWLSGEMAGESIQELLGDLLWDLSDLSGKWTDTSDARYAKNDEIEGAYENAAGLAFWAEVERSAKA